MPKDDTLDLGPEWEGYEYDEVLTEDDGEAIDWEQLDGPVLLKYRGKKVVQSLNEVKTKENNGTPVYDDVDLILWVDASGENRSSWAPYKLAEAMEKINEGDVVRVEYLGKKDIGSGQTLNRFTVTRGKAKAKAPASVAK
jgi:hypothetical protein